MEEFDKLAESLKAAGITKSSMFGTPVLKLGAKPIAGLAPDGIHFKLPVDSSDMKEALAISGAHLYQPEMHGKKGPVMKQWVVVPFAHKDHYPSFALAAMKFVESELNKKTSP